MIGLQFSQFTLHAYELYIARLFGAIILFFDANMLRMISFFGAIIVFLLPIG